MLSSVLDHNTCKDLIEQKVDMFDLGLYERLFYYYMDQMPYGIAKCRDGDPVDWILTKLSHDIAELEATNDENII